MEHVIETFDLSRKFEIHTDQHLCGIFKLETWRSLLKDAGFDVNELKFDHSTLAEDESYPMFVCTKLD